MSGTELLRDPDRAGDVDAGRAADHQTLFAEQIEDDRQRLVIGHLQRVVDRRTLQVLGDAALTDPLGDRVALGPQLAVLVVVVQRRAEWIGEYDAHRRLALLQGQADAAERAAGADRRDERVDRTAGLLPDLRSGGLIVRTPVGEVVELVGPDGAAGLALRQLRGQPLRDAHVV